MIITATNSIPDLPVKYKMALFLLAVMLIMMGCVSICIPLCARTQDHANSAIYHPRLFPLYYQTNIDAPIGLHSSLGFPFFFRESQYRVNRPLVIGVTAGVRMLVVPVLRVLLPKKTLLVMWGDHRALEVLITYCSWIVLNVVAIGCAALLLFSALKPVFGKGVALVAALLLLSAPITVLSMREITEGAVQILIASLSLFFWQRVIMENVKTPYLLIWSLGIGMLFTGKLAVTTFAAGALLCLFSRKRKLLGLIILCALLPLLCWIGAMFAFGIPFSFNEIDHNIPALSTIVSQSTIPRIFSFTPSWLAILGEDGLLVQLPFALLGFYKLYKNKFLLIRVVPVFICIDFCFFLALNRAHAVYGIHTMIFCYPAVALGVVMASRWIAEKAKTAVISVPLVAAMIVLVMQAILLVRTIPAYNG